MEAPLNELEAPPPTHHIHSHKLEAPQSHHSHSHKHNSVRSRVISVAPPQPPPVELQPESAKGGLSAILHFSLLIVLTALASVLYSRSSAQHITHIDTWAYTPRECNDENGRAHCAELEGIHHAPTNHSDCDEDGYACALHGAMPEFERPATGLLSAVSVPVLVLTFQVIVSSFSMLYVHYESDEGTAERSAGSWLRRSLKHMALLVLLSFAVLFLFIQHAWEIPMNNLLIVEILIGLSVFYIGCNSSSVYAREEHTGCKPTIYVEMALSMPALTASALACVGVDTASDLLVSFFAAFFTYIVLMSLEVSFAADSKVTNELLFISWLTTTPLVVHFSSALYYVGDHKAWGIAALSLLLAFVLIYQLAISVCTLTSVLSRGDMRLFLDWLALIGRSVIALTIMIGALA